METKKRNISLFATKKRQSAFRLKQTGWQTALENKLVPSKQANDIDPTRGEKLLLVCEKETTELERFTKDYKSQTNSTKEFLVSEKKKAKSVCDNKITAAKTERDEAIRFAREKFAEAEAAARTELENQLAKLETTNDEIRAKLETKKEMQGRLNEAHESLGNFLYEFDAVINAAFPFPNQKDLREAINRGDVDFVKNWEG